MMRFTVFLLVILGSFSNAANAQTIVDFEDVGALLTNESFYNGSDLAGGFTSGSLSFNNTFDTQFGSWSGWSYSNTTDTTTPTFDNQYSAIVGSGDAGSATYAVAFGFGDDDSRPEIRSTTGRAFQSLAITNTTFAALTIRDGSQFSDPFGGNTGNDPDFFKVDILSLDDSGNEIDSIEFFLADFRFDDNNLDFIVDQWTTVDVSQLDATRLGFRFSGSDVGPFGLNTPAYFALDNVVLAVPEPGSASVVALFAITAFCRRIRGSASVE